MTIEQAQANVDYLREKVAEAEKAKELAYRDEQHAILHLNYAIEELNELT